MQIKSSSPLPKPSGTTPSLEIPKGFSKIRLLGSGGFADVVLAKDRGRRQVVLKIIRNPGKEKAKAIQEAQIQYNLGHKNIVQVYDLILDPLCIVEEYCEGGNLLDQISPKPLPEVVKLLVQTGISIANVLWVIHNCGYVHLDIKPENILFKKEGKDFIPKLADFGTAKALGSVSGGMTCTPQYLSPNYPLPIDTSDPRLDIYQLGLSLYFPLAACALRKSNLDIERIKINPIFLSSQCPEIVPELDTVLHKAINVRGKDFSKAYQNAMDFANDLAKIKIT
jgi:serine/threonine-protein kinase PpkA